MSLSLIIEFSFLSITLKKASTKRFLVLLILSQKQYILCLFLILRHHLLFPSPIPNYAWFCLFLPYLSICLDVRSPCFFQSIPPAVFVTWGGNSAGLNAKVFREGLISRVQTRSFSYWILFSVHSFFFLFLLFPSIFSLPSRIPRSNKLEILNQYLSVAWQQPTSHWLDPPKAVLDWPCQTCMYTYILQYLAMLYWNRHVTPHKNSKLYLQLCCTATTSTTTICIWNMFKNALCLNTKQCFLFGNGRTETYGSCSNPGANGISCDI